MSTETDKIISLRKEINHRTTIATLEIIVGFIGGISGVHLISESKDLVDYIASCSSAILGSAVIVKGIYDFTRMYNLMLKYLENNSSENSSKE